MQMSDPTKEYSIRLRREAWDYLWQLVTQSEAGTTDWQAEAERYRKGMLNWKMTAEAKDAQIADLMRSETASMNAAPQTPDTATCGDVGASNAEADRRAGAEKGTALPVTGVRLDARERSATSEGSYGGARSAGAAPSDKHREAARLRKLLGEKKLREMDREERALVAHAAMKWAHSLQSADVCSACGAKEGEPCRGNCERRMPSHEQRTGKLMMTCPQCGWRAGVPEGWTPSATAPIELLRVLDAALNLEWLTDDIAAQPGMAKLREAMAGCQRFNEAAKSTNFVTRATESTVRQK
jgi:hypothetical protein